MSNTATVTPYQSSPAEDRTAEAIGAALGALFQAFAATDSEREAIARYRTMARRGCLSAARLDIRLVDNGDLLRAARSLGYAGGAADLARLNAGRPIELVGVGGSSMLLRRSGESLDVVSAGGQAAIGDVVRRVTVDRTQRHLEKLSGGKVSIRKLASGDIELQARENRAQADDSATVKTRIDANGVVHVDINNIRGGRCAQVTAGLAAEIGGQVSGTGLKCDYYAGPINPGEPVHLKAGN